jgi:glycosyltransferase involved in cell wall biosynthesis
MLSVYILTFNEESKIADAIESVRWADEVIVVDSGSTDRTLEIASRYEVRIEQVPFEGFGKLRNSAVALCTHPWVFSLDADERCTPEAREEMLSIIGDPNASDAYLVPRRNYFLGRWIRHSGWYPDYRQPQLFRKGRLRYQEDLVHEGYEVDGAVGRMINPIWQFPFKDLTQLMNKSNRYSTLMAEKFQTKGVKGSMFKALLHGTAAFLRHYIIRAGFLDGWAGLAIAYGSFEGAFYKYAKLTALQRGWNNNPKSPPPG